MQAESVHSESHVRLAYKSNPILRFIMGCRQETMLEKMAHIACKRAEYRGEPEHRADYGGFEFRTAHCFNSFFFPRSKA